MRTPIAAACFVVAGVAHAGDSPFFAPERTARVVGTNVDGSTYAVAIAGRFEEEQYRDACRYAAVTGIAPAGVDELRVEVRKLRDQPTTLTLLDWPVSATDKDPLQTSLCTPTPVLNERLATLRAALAAQGITLSPSPLPELAVGATGDVLVPAAAMAAVGVDADVWLTVKTRPGGAWISARAEGYGDERIQQVKAGISVDGATATLLPGRQTLVVVPRNFRNWIFDVTEVPLARLAVRLLTARGERTGDVADIDKALALDPSFARAQKAKAKATKTPKTTPTP